MRFDSLQASNFSVAENRLGKYNTPSPLVSTRGYINMKISWAFHNIGKVSGYFSNCSLPK